MGRRLTNQNTAEYFFVTTSFVSRQSYGNIDGVYDILSEALNFRADKTNAKVMAYVFMPSHIHLALKINGDNLSSFMRDFKKYTAQSSLASLIHKGKIWQDRYDRVAIWNEDILLQKIRCIHNNPVKAGLVGDSEKWRWSSAVDYIGRKNGPVKVWINWYE
jgi:REP element-mobilizing transposase RayT